MQLEQLTAGEAMLFSQQFPPADVYAAQSER
jgi:hypothetical protein